MRNISYSSVPIPQVVQQTATTAGDLVSHTLEFDINSSSNKIGNNERQWEVGGEFLSANLVSALGEISQNYSLDDY